MFGMQIHFQPFERRGAKLLRCRELTASEELDRRRERDSPPNAANPSQFRYLADSHQASTVPPLALRSCNTRNNVREDGPWTAASRHRES